MIERDELDFCLLHGYEHMKTTMGNPIAWCEMCDDLRDAAAEIKRLRSVLEGLSHVHDGNPSDVLGNLSPLEYARHMLSEVRQTCREALKPIPE